MQQIEQACHEIYKDNWERLNKRLLQASYFIRNILDLSAIMALGNLKPNISWHTIAIYQDIVKPCYNVYVCNFVNI